MSSERRKFRRVPMPIEIQADAGGDVYSVTGENISLGGMLVRAPKTLEANTKVRLRFTLPGTNKEITVTGTVQHVSPGAFMGVRFENLSAEDLQAIQKFVGSKEPAY